MIAADLNHDGHTDLLVFGAGMQVLVNNGSGDFGGPIAVNLPPSYTAVQQVALADFNADGFSDVAACVSGSNGTSGAAAIYLNDHSGKLILGQVVPAPAACSGIAAGDANRDGKSDFAFTYYTGSFSAPVNTVATWFGDGTGHFANPATQANLALTATQDASMNPCSIAASIGADFDADGNLDLLLFGTCQSSVINPGDLYLARGDGAGHYTLKEVSEGNTSVAGTPMLTDINNDGKPDVVFLEEQFGPHGSDGSQVMYAMNSGAGGFTETKVASESAYAGDGSYITAGSPLSGENTALEGFHSMSCCGTPAAYGVRLFNPVDSAATQTWIYGQSTTTDLPGRVLAIVSADFNGNSAQDFAVLEADANNVVTLHVYVK
jgi:VCBS repeat protein